MCSLSFFVIQVEAKSNPANKLSQNKQAYVWVDYLMDTFQPFWVFW